MDFGFIAESLGELARGLPLTIQLALISVATGFGLAILLVLAQRSRFRPAALAAKAYVFVFRGTPLLVQIYLIYYGPAQFESVRQSVFWPFLREPYWCALLSLSLVTAAYGSEVIRGGLESVPRGVVEAARASGMSPFLVNRFIVFPLALRNALPAYGNEILIMVKATSLASVVTLMEVTGIAYRLIAETYRVTLIFLLAGALYLALNALIVLAIGVAERRISVLGRPQSA